MTPNPSDEAMTYEQTGTYTIPKVDAVETSGDVASFITQLAGALLGRGGRRKYKVIAVFQAPTRRSACLRWHPRDAALELHILAQTLAAGERAVGCTHQGLGHAPERCSAAQVTAATAI